MQKLLLNRRWIRPITLMFLCLVFFKQSQSQTRTVVYDWNTGFTNSLPFDERFIIQITNLPVGIKLLELEIKKADDLHAKGQTNLEKYFDGLKTGQLIPFKIITSVPRVTSVEYAKLEPNEDYLMRFYVKEEMELNDTEKNDLRIQLEANELFKQEILNLLVRQDYYSLSSSTLNHVFNKYVEAIDTKFKIKDASDNQAKELLNTANASVTLQNIASKINALKIFLDSKSKAINTEKLYAEYLVTNKSGLQFANIDIGTNNFLTRLNSTNISVLKNIKDSTTKANAKAKIDEVESAINDFINTYKTQVDKTIDDNIIKLIVENSYKLFTLNNTVPAEIKSRASVYISQSVGAGYSIGTENIPSYLTYSFFFRPVNQEIALSTYRGNDWWKVRLCMNLGITINDITTNKNGVISGAIGNKGLIVGAGFRVLPFLKVDVNGLIYYLNNPNPLNDHKKINVSPMFGLTANLNIARLFAGDANSLTDLKNYFKIP